LIVALFVLLLKNKTLQPQPLTTDMQKICLYICVLGRRGLTTYTLVTLILLLFHPLYAW